VAELADAPDLGSGA